MAVGAKGEPAGPPVPEEADVADTKMQAAELAATEVATIVPHVVVVKTSYWVEEDERVSWGGDTLVSVGHMEVNSLNVGDVQTP